MKNLQTNSVWYLKILMEIDKALEWIDKGSKGDEEEVHPHTEEIRITLIKIRIVINLIIKFSKYPVLNHQIQGYLKNPKIIHLAMLKTKGEQDHHVVIAKE